VVKLTRRVCGNLGALSVRYGLTGLHWMKGAISLTMMGNLYPLVMDWTGPSLFSSVVNLGTTAICALSNIIYGYDCLCMAPAMTTGYDLWLWSMIGYVGYVRCFIEVWLVWQACMALCSYVYGIWSSNVKSTVSFVIASIRGSNQCSVSVSALVTSVSYR